MQLTENLTWRYATKKFDPSRKISPGDLDKLREAIRLSATSYGLQLYKAFIISEPGIRKKLLPASWNQSQVTDASHLIVLCYYTEANAGHVDEYIRLRAEIQDVAVEDLKGYGDFVTQKLLEKPLHEQKEWNARQTYLVLGHLLTACAELRIDACPMEGFDPEAYDQILGLSAMGLSASVAVTIGYRSPEDSSQYQKKVRKHPKDLFVEL
ncbi:NAD(P)H-dependent oxidoreductase [Sinomicrobium pectinilyticum]|uniref:NAD(P)H-dependent oxidoreductase n=1 Tax=Sinomicrobium pectinilyticum TaxID=1084421 RepID=A0A3N0E5L1_SINP1|nr:NAD(P)H-dependent oxidoreductase [Sinomicrobium pectinilyticum]RNL83121.1 NAD(P)H-dependent oxidoreductase [Sinomicrobium pectinilyticum]